MKVHVKMGLGGKQDMLARRSGSPSSEAQNSKCDQDGKTENIPLSGQKKVQGFKSNVSALGSDESSKVMCSQFV